MTEQEIAALAERGENFAKEGRLEEAEAIAKQLWELPTQSPKEVADENNAMKNGIIMAKHKSSAFARNPQLAARAIAMDFVENSPLYGKVVIPSVSKALSDMPLRAIFSEFQGFSKEVKK